MPEQLVEELKQQMKDSQARMIEKWKEAISKINEFGDDADDYLYINGASKDIREFCAQTIDAVRIKAANAKKE